MQALPEFDFHPAGLAAGGGVRNRPAALRRQTIRMRKPKPETGPGLLKGWSEIARFLGQPLSVAQRWAKSDMPVQRAGRHITASPSELNIWLRRESAGEPLSIASETADLSAELKRGLSYARKRAKQKP
jgi:hypothetical protein